MLSFQAQQTSEGKDKCSASVCKAAVVWSCCTPAPRGVLEDKSWTSRATLGC